MGWEVILEFQIEYKLAIFWHFSISSSILVHNRFFRLNRIFPQFPYLVSLLLWSELIYYHYLLLDNWLYLECRGLQEGGSSITTTFVLFMMTKPPFCWYSFHLNCTQLVHGEDEWFQVLAVCALLNLNATTWFTIIEWGGLDYHYHSPWTAVHCFRRIHSTPLLNHSLSIQVSVVKYNKHRGLQKALKYKAEMISTVI